MYTICSFQAQSSSECLLPSPEQTSEVGTILTYILLVSEAEAQRGEITFRIKSQPQAHIYKMNHFCSGPHIYSEQKLGWGGALQG